MWKYNTRRQLTCQVVRIKWSCQHCQSVYLTYSSDLPHNVTYIPLKGMRWEKIVATIEQSRLIEEAVDYIRSQTPSGFSPKVGVVLGSGLGHFTSAMSGRQIEYNDIPNFPHSTVPRHAGRLHLGVLDETTLIVMEGRTHLYEKLVTPDEIVFGVRTMIELGAKTLIITNAAGSINRNYRVGELVLIRDHINLAQITPLIGPAFVDMTRAYDLALLDHASGCFQKLGLGTPHQGTYSFMVGPQYETPAEVEMLRRLGAVLVGMSTVLEMIAARAAGARVLGISLVSNKAASSTGTPLSHAEVQTAGRQAASDFQRLLTEIITTMPE